MMWIPANGAILSVNPPPYDDTPLADEHASQAFTDDSWITETEPPPLEEDFADLLADASLPDLPTQGCFLARMISYPI